MNVKYLYLSIMVICLPAQADFKPVDLQPQIEQTTAAHELQQKAKAWNLNEEDYQRYQQLMQGPRGIQSPGLDPLTTLGIEARNAAEQRKYAEMWVKQEFARTQKELEFQRAVNSAWQRLYPDTLPVMMGGNHEGQQAGGRLALFVKSADCLACDVRITRVLAKNQPVDIYLVDSQGDDNKLREWARTHQIPPEKVRSRQITLNHDGGRWMRFGNGMMPVILQQGENGWRPVTF